MTAQTGGCVVQYCGLTVTTLAIKITISHISHLAPSPTPALLNTKCVQHLGIRHTLH